MAGAARREGRVVRQHRLAEQRLGEQRLGDGSAEKIRDLSHLSARVQSALAH
jgi:hypothetical protein